ncbi:hypothetical protein K469DRAFT_600109 [Zopfia rhizophila CBS 207.26]|uniref:Peptidase S59 domain-containing protein n=1 Tax=Zopfia rhizophila CBS 207.26 TaxID=1314779 RepID=A0A6A6DKC0_9PEZI|nr:hypothetical protein K469DRAFT_600109 [Zopfia rhizophila CBS 207.26]
MSFGSGGFSGFGSNNNSTFGSGGGFGSNNNNSGGFGSNTNTFGSSNSGGSLFGNNNNTSTGFGGFGSNNNNTSFGSRPFASTSGGGLFGGSTATSGSGGFGGFGSTANNTTSTGFGGSNTGGGLFGQNKPGFGSSTTGTGGLFGGGNTTASTTGGFGSTNTTGGFGGSAPGGFVNQPSPNNGTASTPFTAFQEKDGSGSTSTQHFQTITFQPQYSNYSLEELRLVDYNQGRRYGNQNGQAGAFGQSTGFGGFGNTNNNTSAGFGSNSNPNPGGGLFGGNNTSTTNTGFGSSNTNTGFGSNTNTGGGLFGQNKPGGLFGSTPTSQPSGGLFGNPTASNTGGGFGSGSTTFGSSNTGGNLFGQQNQNQTKPFGGFGSNTSNTTNPFGGSTGTTGFGQTNTSTGGGLFGQQNQTSSAPTFGSNQQTSNTGGGLFGGGGAFSQNQQNQNQSSSGGLFSGFGQNNQPNQQKPSLFGGSTATNQGPSLFGQNNQNQQSGGLFNIGSNTNNQSQGSGLFGQKPATAGSNLFGGATTNTGSTGGMFGNPNTQNQQQNQQGSGPFGQQNQQKPSLFGGSTTTNTNTGGLFSNLGQSNTNTSGLGGSLFGSQNQQQQTQQPQLGNSLFGASGNSLLQTSMTTNPYGNDALFAGLATPTTSPGPLATPLSSSQKLRKSAILPQHKLNASANSRLITPQKKIGGYGFTYSTYGTPNSASSSSSPGFSSSLLAGGGFTRSLGKSLSTSNLRNSYTPETSILAPGAFSTNGRSFAGGSMKKLNVNRNINARGSLFGNDNDTPSTVKKTVSFDRSANGGDRNGITNGTENNGSTNGALVLRRESDDDSPGAEEASSRTSSTPTVNGNVTNGASSRPEMQQVNGKELTPVPENGVALGDASSSSLNAKQPGQKVPDPQPGDYWSTPSLDVLRKMSRQELQSVNNFVVGRNQIGKIEFNPGNSVDLSGVDLDKLFNDIIELTPRNATVYGAQTTVPKPAEGTSLNVPSRITLENSWPRAAPRGHKKEATVETNGFKLQKHIERLKRVGNTKFEKYIVQTGEWIFRVDHFSSYGLNDDDFDSDEEMESSELSPVPDTPAQLGSSQMTGTPQEGSILSPTQSSPDDTFDFKKGKRKRVSLPGEFEDELAYEEDDLDDSMNTNGESFLGERSAGLLDGQHDVDYSESSESESVEEQDMAGSVSGPVQTAEHPAAKESDPFKDSVKPKSILKVSQPLKSVFGTPSKGQLVFDDNWANQLQRTISPKKQDRQALRQSQGDVLRERDGNITKLAQSLNGQTIATSIDLMNSLFGETDKQSKVSAKRVGHGIELPYAKRPKTSNDLDELSGSDKHFHSCNKPHFSANGTLVYSNKGTNSLEGGVFTTAQETIIGAHKDTRFTKLPTFPDASPQTLNSQHQHTKIFSDADTGVPFARVDALRETGWLDFTDVAKSVAIDNPAGVHEQKAWELLAILFDEYDEIPSDMSQEHFSQHAERFRKDKLSDFWESLVFSDAERHAQKARTPEEKAIAYISGHNIADACHNLLSGLDLRLATIVSQIDGGDLMMRRDMATQIEEWRRMDTLAEMDDSVRALYELLAGNCGRSEGKIGDGRENRASTFNIAGRFGLDWRRAFGLRLWYGTLVDEPIEMAVAQFADALREGREDVKPVPWFVEQDIDTGWKDPEPNSREDILWGILKLYASSKLDLPANLEDVLAPENVSGHPLNARQSFQMFQLFKARQEEDEEGRKVSMPTSRSANGLRESFLSSTASAAEKDDQADDALTALGDNLTLTYAASLHTTELWTTAVFVYMHLSLPAMREHYIRSLLEQYSHTFSAVDSDPIFNTLSQKLRIPTAWIYSAAALQAKTGGDDVRQTTYLIKAGELDEAHEVLCRSVGPSSIVSRDYDALRELLGDFIPSPTNSHANKEPVQGWSQGGQVYFDYIHLLDLTSHQSSYRVDDALNKDIRKLLSGLQYSLEAVARDKWESRGLEERVALAEIAGVVAELVAQNEVCFHHNSRLLESRANLLQHENKARVLKLPLTEDRWLRHTRELSMGYYRAVIAGAR